MAKKKPGRKEAAVQLDPVKKGAPPRLSPEAQKALFLEAFRMGGSIRSAAAMVESQVGRFRRGNVSRWLKTDPEFRQDFRDARRDAVELLIEECTRRAVGGPRPSDTLLIFLLKGLSPRRFGDKKEAAKAGGADGPSSQMPPGDPTQVHDSFCNSLQVILDKSPYMAAKIKAMVDAKFAAAPPTPGTP